MFFNKPHTPKVALPVGHLHLHVIRILRTHPTQHSELHLDRFSRFCRADGRESLHFTMCVRTRLTRDWNSYSFYSHVLQKCIMSYRRFDVRNQTASVECLSLRRPLLAACFSQRLLRCKSPSTWDCATELTDTTEKTRMWANAQRDGRPAEYRWRPLFNAAKFGDAHY